MKRFRIEKRLAIIPRSVGNHDNGRKGDLKDE